MTLQEIFEEIDKLSKGDYIGILTGENYQETGYFDEFHDNILSYFHDTSTNPLDNSYNQAKKSINVGKIKKLNKLLNKI
jgi:hypothetical protein